jgi:hypothetical protein
MGYEVKPHRPLEKLKAPLRLPDPVGRKLSSVQLGKVFFTSKRA